MDNTVKFMNITSLGEISRLSEEERKQLDEICPTFPDLYRFVLANRHLKEVGVMGILAMQREYPSSPDPYKTS